VGNLGRMKSISLSLPRYAVRGDEHSTGASVEKLSSAVASPRMGLRGLPPDHIGGSGVIREVDVTPTSRNQPPGKQSSARNFVQLSKTCPFPIQCDTRPEWSEIGSRLPDFTALAHALDLLL